MYENDQKGYGSNEMGVDDPYDFLHTDEIDFLTPPKKDSLTGAEKQPILGGPTKIVENRRQVFEKSHSLSKPSPPKPTPERKKSSTPLKRDASSSTTIVAAANSNILPSNEQIENSKSISTPNSQPDQNSKSNQQQQQQQQLLKKKKDDECRQIMSRANIETVAERAAHFEEIDFEKYNRLKNRLDEYDWGQDDKNQQATGRNALDKQNLRMLLYGYADQKNMGNEAGYLSYEKFMNSGAGGLTPVQLDYQNALNQMFAMKQQAVNSAGLIQQGKIENKTGANNQFRIVGQTQQPFSWNENEAFHPVSAAAYSDERKNRDSNDLINRMSSSPIKSPTTSSGNSQLVTVRSNPDGKNMMMRSLKESEEYNFSNDSLQMNKFHQKGYYFNLI